MWSWMEAASSRRDLLSCTDPLQGVPGNEEHIQASLYPHSLGVTAKDSRVLREGEAA